MAQRRAHAEVVSSQYRMRRIGSCASVWLFVGLCLSTPLYAQSSSISGAVGVSSQLVDRGLAITPATPILQGAVSWTSASGWSLGISGGTEVRSPGQATEASAQLSRYWSLSSSWQMQASLLYYSYPGNDRSKVFDRTEVGVNWIYRDVLTLGLSAIRVSGASDSQPRGAADIDLHWPLPWHFSVSAGAGVAQPLIGAYSSYGYGYEHGSLYGYGHVGLMWNNDSWRVELDRIVTNPGARRQWGDLAASPWVATISRSF